MKPLLVIATIAAAGVLLAVPPQSQGQMMGHGGSGGMGGGMLAPPPSAGKNPLPKSGDVIAKGKSLYDTNCAVCHGAHGRGDGPAAAGLNPHPPDLRAAAKWSDGQIAAQILNGRGQMPPFGKSLDRTSVWSIVRYVRQLQR